MHLGINRQGMTQQRCDMDNKGKGSGLALLGILIVALIVAWLFVQQMGSLGAGGDDATGTQTEQSVDPEMQTDDPVDAAQDAVDAVNQNMLENAQDPE